MRDLSKYEEIIIWGACFSPEEIEGDATSHGHAAEKLYALLSKNGYANKIIMWVDSNIKLYGKTRYGKPVMDPREILNHRNALVIINSLSMQAILHKADSMGVSNDILIIPYYFYHGVLEHPYDNDVAREVIENYGDEIKELFCGADEETNRYLNIIFEMRKKCEDDLYPREYYELTGGNMDYFCDQTIAPSGDVTLIDVGAYEGESIEPIRKFYGDHFRYCIAFEPDSRSVKKLIKYVENSAIEDKCKIFACALGNEEKLIRFSETGSTSQLSDNGKIELEQKVFDELDVDSVVGDAMIKMDIEGAEENAIKGMKNFIRKNKPYLAICMYHKEDDIYRLPKLIKSLYQGYRLYIRGGDGILSVGQFRKNEKRGNGMMSRQDIRLKLNDIFADVFADEQISLNENTNANDIEGWDSLTHITILEAVQDEYGVAFDLDEIIEMQNVGDMIDAISRKID